MSAFRGKEDAIQRPSERPQIATSGHSYAAGGDMVGSWDGRRGNLQGPKSQWEDLRKEKVKQC